jgi:hypothetical protein
MQAVVRFWVSVLSLLVSVAAVGYLFISFLFPETALVFDTNGVRLGVMFVALVGTGTLVWAAVFSETTQRPGTGSQKP